MIENLLRMSQSNGRNGIGCTHSPYVRIAILKVGFVGLDIGIEQSLIVIASAMRVSVMPEKIGSGGK